MREILFRGKRVGNGEWVVGTYLGDYFSDGRLFCIRNDSCNYSVDPSTVGQYTGLPDKNGVKIFEGDILLIGDSKEPVLVEFIKFSWECTSKSIGPYYRHRLEGNSQKYEVVGNIHDTHELLEKKEDLPMTREEAAKILEYPVYKWSLDWDEREDGLDYGEAIKMAVSALRAQADTPPNDLLTTEQLQKMDESVWVECGVTPFTPAGGYYCSCQNGNITTPSGMQFRVEDIPHWKFYRRKPDAQKEDKHEAD